MSDIEIAQALGGICRWSPEQGTYAQPQIVVREKVGAGSLLPNTGQILQALQRESIQSHEAGVYRANRGADEQIRDQAGFEKPIISLQYAYTLKQAAGLFNYFGKKEEAAQYESLASALIKNTYRYCFDATKNAMANTPLKNTFSQHASIMAILTGSIPQHDMQKVLQTILTDKSLSQATFYYPVLSYPRYESSRHVQQLLQQFENPGAICWRMD